MVGQCDFWAKQYLPKSSDLKIREDRPGTCIVDYTDEELKDDIDSAADCDSRCGEDTFADESEEENSDKEFTDCVENCKDQVNTMSQGSIHYKDSGEVLNGSVPIACSQLWPDSDGEGFHDAPGLDSDKMAKLEEDLRTLGCTPISDSGDALGWMHGHEFAEPTAGTEPEEDPAACWIHVRAKGPKQCMIDDLMTLVRPK